MTFTEIFENFKNHSYIRRECWSEDVFIQLRNTATLIRLVMFATTDTSTIKLIGYAGGAKYVKLYITGTTTGYTAYAIKGRNRHM